MIFCDESSHEVSQSFKLTGKNFVFYLPRGFEGNNQRLQFSSTGPVGERNKSQKVTRNVDLAYACSEVIFRWEMEALCLHRPLKKSPGQGGRA